MHSFLSPIAFRQSTLIKTLCVSTTDSSQNCAEFQINCQRFCFKLFSIISHIKRKSKAHVFSGLRLNGLGSSSKWNQIHKQLEDAIYIFYWDFFSNQQVSWRKNPCKKCWQMWIWNSFQRQKSDFTLRRWLLEILKNCCKKYILSMPP